MPDHPQGVLYTAAAGHGGFGLTVAVDLDGVLLPTEAKLACGVIRAGGPT
jgi:hypothetical protein